MNDLDLMEGWYALGLHIDMGPPEFCRWHRDKPHCLERTEGGALVCPVCDRV